MLTSGRLRFATICLGKGCEREEELVTVGKKNVVTGALSELYRKQHCPQTVTVCLQVRLLAGTTKTPYEQLVMQTGYARAPGFCSLSGGGGPLTLY